MDDPPGADIAYQRALDLARPLGHRPAMFLALTGLAVVRRLQGHDRAATDAAIEALEVHVAGSPRRLANRVDPRADVLPQPPRAAPSSAAVAADRDQAEQAARLLGHAAHLRTDAHAQTPPFLRDDTCRATDAVTSILGPERFAAATRAGRDGRLGAELDFRA